MSNTPPPPPFQPPGPPLSGGAPGASGAPAWQTGSASLQPGSHPPKSKKLPLIIGGMVVIAIVVAVAVFALGGSDSSDPEPVSAAAAREGLSAVLDNSSYDEEGNDELRVCPLGDLDDLYDAVAAVIELDPAVANGVDERSAREEDDLPGFVSCQRYAEDEDKVESGPTSVFFQAVLEPPGDYEEYITEFAGDVTEVDFDESVDYNGGEVVLFCAEAVEDSGFTGCDADWVDTKNKIAINVFLGGSDAKAEDALTALKAVLSTMSDNLANLAETES